MEGIETDEIPGLGTSRSHFAAVPSPTSSQYLTPPSSANSITTPSTQTLIPPESAFTRLSRNRGARRPVASDFVDVEDVRSSTSNSGPSNMTKRKTRFGMDFSNIGSMRRCIIDLSDSEDDGHFPDNTELSKRSQTTPAIRTNYSSNTPRISSRSSPTPFASAKARSTTVTPSPEASALELQILKMREEIAQMEQNVKRKAVCSHTYQMVWSLTLP